MTAFTHTLTLETEARVSYTDVTPAVLDAVRESGISNGILVVSSPHTTCSIVVQEESHDRDYYGTEFLMQDLTEVLEKVVPRSLSEGQYHHPGPEHIESAKKLRQEEAWWSLNVDAHLRSAILGRSESIPVVDGVALLGEFGRIYFADFDQVRARPRTVNLVVVGG